MTNEEKKVIETVENFIKYYKKNEQTGNRANLDVLREEVNAIEFILNKYDVQQNELKYQKNYLQMIEEQKDDIIKSMFERIKELESDNYECNNRINDYIETINKIQEEFLKYDWKNSNNEQIYNQLKSLYNEIFKNKAKESGEIDEG